jgi:hypothetical protein
MPAESTRSAVVTCRSAQSARGWSRASPTEEAIIMSLRTKSITFEVTEDRSVTDPIAPLPAGR